MKTMKGFGLQPSPPSVRDYDFFAVCGAGEEKPELPSRFQLPMDEWAEVLDQGLINACPAFALATAQECHHYKSTGEKKRYSPGYIYGHPECRPNYDGPGMYLRSAIKGVTKVGFVEHSIFDILEEMPRMKCFVESRTDLTDIGSKRKLKGFVNLNYSLQPKKIEAMKRAIYDYRIPLVVASYEYFGGGHAFLLHGWDDDAVHKKARKGTQIFDLRNSWGEDWEDNGNSTIPVTYIDEVYLPIFEDMLIQFEDVKEDDWFFNDVRSAVFSGLVQGVNAKEFAPYASMKRGDMAVIIERMLRKATEQFNAFSRTLNQKNVTAYTIALRESFECKFDFKDVDDSAYYADAIRMVCANHIMNGTSETSFEPERAITRAETAVIVTRAVQFLGELLSRAVPSAKIGIEKRDVELFKDMSLMDWFYTHVYDAAGLGLMQGDEDGHFRPNDSINRAECTAVLNRLFRLVDKMLEAMSA